MKGIELSKRYYLEHGAPMLHSLFPELEPLIAVGLTGSGSECFGFDDKISRDHDFEPAFCLFLPEEALIDRKTEFALEIAYSRLPKLFMGFKRTNIDPVGGKRHGVMRISDFFLGKIGSADGRLDLRDWFHIPEPCLAEATNGEIFRDDFGRLTSIRQRIAYYPEDVRLKKIAGNLVMMGQAGQYNYPRSMQRGDTASAQLSCIEFVKSALNVIFLLNRVYTPYYKWVFRALGTLPVLTELGKPLEVLISTPNTEDSAQEKQNTIELVCSSICTELRRQGLTDNQTSGAETQAYTVNDRIADITVRNLHILYAV